MNAIDQELLALNEKHGGVAPPRAVVDFARNPETALHACFTWDDGKAAERYRIIQARRLIRARVYYEPRLEKKVRAFVSLEDDRNPQGGYRLLSQVLSDDDLRARLLEEARREMVRFVRKYESLEELAGVRKAMSEAMSEAMNEALEERDKAATG